jgi:H+/Cl- antiporter ClcA
MPTATSTLATLGEVIVNTTVSFVTTVFTTYWPYVLLAIVLGGIVALMYRLVHLSTGRSK